jgi:hypothetical protein
MTRTFSDKPATPGAVGRYRGQSNRHHTRLRGLIQGGGDLLVLQRVHLELDSCLLTGLGVMDLAVDLGQQRRFEHFGRRQQLAIVALGHITSGQIIEQLGQIFTNGRIAGQQAQIAVQAGGAGMVVAGADVGVTAQPLKSRRTTRITLLWVFSPTTP